MDHPKDVGDRSQLAIMLALRRAGFGLLVPFGENTRYDLVIDDGTNLSRVQCKTGRLRRGAVVWSVCSSYAHQPNPKAKRRDYRSDVDFFAVYCSDSGLVYLVPISDVPLKRQARLRIDPPRNGQRRFIRFGAQYEVGQVLKAEPGASSGAPAPSA
jgi:hypothetical protein